MFEKIPVRVKKAMGSSVQIHMHTQVNTSVGRPKSVRILLLLKVRYQLENESYWELPMYIIFGSSVNH